MTAGRDRRLVYVPPEMLDGRHEGDKPQYRERIAPRTEPGLDGAPDPPFRRKVPPCPACDNYGLTGAHDPACALLNGLTKLTSRNARTPRLGSLRIRSVRRGK